MSIVNIFHKDPIPLNLIEETFKASFLIDFDREYWEWRFLNNPNSPKTYISYIIEDGILAAYYAVSPMKILLGGKECKIALSNMTMTHPDHRGKGYFKKLAQALFDDLKKDGFIGVFGFANHNSHYGFRKYLNWSDLSALNIFSVKPNDFRNIKIHDDSVLLKDEPLSKEIFDSINFLSASELQKTQILRNTENVIWRLKKNPNNNYVVQVGRRNKKIVSLVFYKKFKGEIDIMEYFYDSSIDKVNLLNLNISKLIKEKSAVINIWSNLYSEEHINLERQGFQETNFNTYFGVIPFTDNKELLNYNNWHYRFIDSDIF